jgi:hypothetical protein
MVADRVLVKQLKTLLDSGKPFPDTRLIIEIIDMITLD